MTWNIGVPPDGLLVALVLRAWSVVVDGDTKGVFIASDPIRFLQAYGKEAERDLFATPTQTVMYGQVEDSNSTPVVLDEEGEIVSFDTTAILAWSHVPSFALDQAAARQTDFLLQRVRHGN
jgi:hypothetical protein